MHLEVKFQRFKILAKVCACGNGLYSFLNLLIRTCMTTTLDKGHSMCVATAAERRDCAGSAMFARPSSLAIHQHVGSPADAFSGPHMPLEKTLVPAGAELLASFTGPELAALIEARPGVLPLPGTSGSPRSVASLARRRISAVNSRDRQPMANGKRLKGGSCARKSA